MPGGGVEALADVGRHQARLLRDQDLEPGDQRVRLLAGVGVQRPLHDRIGQEHLPAQAFRDDRRGNERRADPGGGEQRRRGRLLGANGHAGTEPLFGAGRVEHVAQRVPGCVVHPLLVGQRGQPDAAVRRIRPGRPGGSPWAGRPACLPRRARRSGRSSPAAVCRSPGRPRRRSSRRRARRSCGTRAGGSARPGAIGARSAALGAGSRTRRSRSWRCAARRTGRGRPVGRRVRLRWCRPARPGRAATWPARPASARWTGRAARTTGCRWCVPAPGSVATARVGSPRARRRRW